MDLIQRTKKIKRQRKVKKNGKRDREWTSLPLSIRYL